MAFYSLEESDNRDTSFFFIFLKRKGFALKLGEGESGRWKRDPGRRSHRTQDVPWMKGGEAMVDKGIQDERNSLVVRHARFAHARSV